MKKIAFLFPGQGAQFVGMGKDIYDNFLEARKIYEKASEILGLSVQKLCFEISEEELNKTENAQIAILVTSLAMLEVLKEHEIKADFCAGLSLGEYTALIHSGILSFEDGIKLVQKRGYYMGNFIPDEEYKMAAVIGLESSKIEEICKNINGFVIPVNYNYFGQTVISGNKEAVDMAIEKLKLSGVKRVVELNTSGPFHTKKLEKAKELFEKELEKIKFRISSIPVAKNIDGTIYDKEDNVKEILANHIISPVRFDKIIKLTKQEEIDTYIEIGPGKALSTFVKKENKDANVMNICDIASLQKVIENLK